MHFSFLFSLLVSHFLLLSSSRTYFFTFCTVFLLSFSCCCRSRCNEYRQSFLKRQSSVQACCRASVGWAERRRRDHPRLHPFGRTRRLGGVRDRALFHPRDGVLGFLSLPSFPFLFFPVCSCVYCRCYR